MYWTTLGRALAPCKIPEICEIQICIDIPVLSIWKLISTGLFVSLFGFMYISSSFFHFLPVFSTFFRKKLEEIPFFQFLPFFPEETYFFRKFPNPAIQYKSSSKGKCSLQRLITKEVERGSSLVFDY